MPDQSDNLFILFLEFISFLANLINVVQFLFKIYINVQNYRIQQSQMTVTQLLRSILETPPEDEDDTFHDTDTDSELTPWAAPPARAVGNTDTVDTCNTPGEKNGDINCSKSAICNAKGCTGSPPPAPPQDSGDCPPPATKERRVPMMKVLTNSKAILQQRANRSRQKQTPKTKGGEGRREIGVQVGDPLCANGRKENRKCPTASAEADVAAVKSVSSDQFCAAKMRCKSTQTRHPGENRPPAALKLVAAASHHVLDGRLPPPDTSSISDTRCCGRGKLARGLKSRNTGPEKQHYHFHRQQTTTGTHRSFPRRPSFMKSSAGWRSHVSSKRNRLSGCVDKRTFRGTVHTSPGNVEKERRGDKEMYEKKREGKLEDGQTSLRSISQKSRARSSRPDSGERSRGSSMCRDTADQHTPHENPRSKWRQVVQNEAGKRRNNGAAVCDSQRGETIRQDAASPEDEQRRRSQSQSAACRSPSSVSKSKGGQTSIRSLVTKLTRSRHLAPGCSTDS